MENVQDPNNKKLRNEEADQAGSDISRVEKNKEHSTEEGSAQLVNEQEQDRIVNPQEEAFGEDGANAFLDQAGPGDDDDDDDDEEIQTPDEDNEIDIPFLPEGDDAEDTKRKLPTMAL